MVQNTRCFLVSICLLCSMQAHAKFTSAQKTEAMKNVRIMIATNAQAKEQEIRGLIAQIRLLSVPDAKELEVALDNALKAQGATGAAAAAPAAQQAPAANQVPPQQ